MKTYNPFPVMEVIERLLGPEGCPWDKKQTPISLCDYLIEETFELVEAIRGGDIEKIEEEMGDVFFLLFFISFLLERDRDMDLNRLWEKNASKMKARHPHVFGMARIESEEELLSRWEEIKKKEKNHRDLENPMDSIPVSLPPLLRAYRIHSKAAGMGFTWPSDKEQEMALCIEWEEWREVREGTDMSKREEEFGDILFSLVEHGRRYGIKANSALHGAIEKFLSRFSQMLALARKRSLVWEELSQEEKDLLWEEVKVASSNSPE